MISRTEFCDLNISNKFEPSNLFLIEQMGYRTIAINNILDESAINTKKKCKQTDSSDSVNLVPVPHNLKDQNTGLTVLNRLTIQIGDISLLPKLFQSENMKKYDILAIIPTTQTAFNHACTAMDVDIIAFSPEFVNNCKINRKLYKQAVERGVCFEISYGGALKDSNYRKHIIQRAHIFFTVGKSSNLLITSGAENYFQIRSPYDLIYLGRILGLDETLSIQSITECARKALLKADNRRRGKAAVFFVTEPETEQKSNKRRKLEMS